MSLAEEHCWICHNHLKDCQCKQPPIDTPTEAEDAGKYQQGLPIEYERVPGPRGSTISNEEGDEGLVAQLKAAESKGDVSESVLYAFDEWAKKNGVSFRTDERQAAAIVFLAGMTHEASRHSVPESGEGGMRWVKLSERSWGNLNKDLIVRTVVEKIRIDLNNVKWHKTNVLHCDFDGAHGWYIKDIPYNNIEWLDEYAESTLKKGG